MLVTATARGLYCAAGDFHIDPWESVERGQQQQTDDQEESAGQTDRFLPQIGQPREGKATMVVALQTSRGSCHLRTSSPRT